METLIAFAKREDTKMLISKNIIVFTVQYITKDDTSQRSQNSFLDYTKARKKAMSYINLRNAFIYKRLTKEIPDKIELFKEISPDFWSNGEEHVRISAIELKNN